MATKTRIGGSFAPPIDDAKIAEYRELAESASDERIRDAMLPLCNMVEAFYQTPRSTLAGNPHPVGIGVVVPLEEDEIKRIWDLVPWDYECDALGKLFETIPSETRKPLRDAAFHLLWFARELTQDREPITSDLI